MVEVALQDVLSQSLQELRTLSNRYVAVTVRRVGGLLPALEKPAGSKPSPFSARASMGSKRTCRGVE
jgi:hypothetical protein